MATPTYAVTTPPVPKGRNLFTWLAALLAATVAAYFWIDSRYPSLWKKLSSGRGIHVNAPLSFDALLPVTPQMPFWTRVAHTAIDWAYTNRIGMTFGVCFGAAMITLLASLPRRRFTNAYANTALGALIGTPLGVCANCVAPVGRGLLQGGATSATMLAAMISSPTLNIVVLIMAFTLLPFRIALLRLLAPVVLLALVPLLVRGHEAVPDALTCSIEALPGRAAKSVVKAYLRNLWRLAAMTLPWMLLAGIIGALVIELVPPQWIPTHVSVFGLGAVAMLSTFAPIPIAFDVVFAWTLLSRGVPAPYVAVVACTLGAFSIYPFLLLGKGLSWRVALRMFSAVTVLGVLAGLIAGLI